MPAAAADRATRAAISWLRHSKISYHCKPSGSVHGGVYAALLDSALGCAVQTMLPAGVGYTSLDLILPG